MLPEPLQSGGIGRERSSDIGFILPLSHCSGFCTLPQCQPQCAQQNRLTGAGFTGDNRHALREIELHMLDQGKLMDRQ